MNIDYFFRRDRRWFCPDCDRLFKRAPKLHEGRYYHSWRCNTPMRRVIVELTSDGAA